MLAGYDLSRLSSKQSTPPYFNQINFTGDFFQRDLTAYIIGFKLSVFNPFCREAQHHNTYSYL